MKHVSLLFLCLTLPLFAIGCVPSGGGSGSGNTNGQDIATGSNADASGATDLVGVDSSSDDLGVAPEPDAGTPAPTSEPAALKPFTGGNCPVLKAGPNSFTSGGMERSVYLHVPNEPAGAGVTFLWHGFGDTTQNFSSAFKAQQMSNEAHMIVVTPTPTVPVPLMGLDSWSFHNFGDTEADLILFDDVLTCLNETFDINEKTVYTMGFSGGALMSSKLLLERSTNITAAVVFSGGTDVAGPDVLAIPYNTPGHKMPVLIAHGGPTDSWGGGPILVKFNEGCDDLAANLTADGHPVILCDHSLGHTIPQGGVDWAWEFLRTAYWSEGESQWKGHSGAPFPNYCTFPQ
jgi:predicted esterase